jgi:HMG-box domain
MASSADPSRHGRVHPIPFSLSLLLLLLSMPWPAPSRPLSAYNFFFQEKRHEWICRSDQEGAELAASIESSTSSDATVARITTEEAATMSKKKAGTPRRFEAMARDMGSRWRALSVSERQKYSDLAAADQARYRREMVEYREKIIRESALGAAYLQRKESAARAAEQQADKSQPWGVNNASKHDKQGKQSKDQSDPAVVTTAAQQDREVAQVPSPSNPSTGVSSTAPTSSAPSEASSRSALSPTANQQQLAVGGTSTSAYEVTITTNQQLATSVGGSSSSAFDTTQRIQSIQEQMRALEEMQRLIDQNSESQLQDNSTPFGLLQQQTNPNGVAMGGNPSNPLPSVLDGMNANQLQTQILLLQLQNAGQQQQRQEEQT